MWGCQIRLLPDDQHRQKPRSRRAEDRNTPFLSPSPALRPPVQISPPPKPSLGIPLSIALCQVIRTLIRIFLRQDQGVWVKK